MLGSAWAGVSQAGRRDLRYGDAVGGRLLFCSCTHSCRDVESRIHISLFRRTPIFDDLIRDISRRKLVSPHTFLSCTSVFLRALGMLVLLPPTWR
ncbi:hypothetical protein E2C01_033059 [Portunus trituberculatus]|uniref:Uncharacterized protein n=1 Tax=Portunus trituberculatus TaxID=210409 RepID=A0A5B7EZ56_PORTR|nr:hypothetical protein [Portunus trituberculatus]